MQMECSFLRSDGNGYNTWALGQDPDPTLVFLFFNDFEMVSKTFFVLF